MAILYKANETDFTHFGLGPLNDAASILVTEERNGIFELKMEYPVEGAAFKELKADRLIKADAGHNLKDQRFKIIRITKPLKGMVTVYAEHVSYLSQDLALKPKVTFTGTADVAIRTWKANLVDENPFIVSSDISTTASGSWTIDKVENPRRALGGVAGSLLDLYGGEYLFDNYQIRLWKQRGKNSTALIAYGRNLTDLTQEEEITSTYTSVYPYSVYQEEGGKDVLLTLPELYLDSEHVGNYARRKILPIDFSQEEIKTEAALRSAAKTYIEANSVGVPKVNLKIKYIDLNKTLDYQNMAVLEEVNLCDHVPVYFEQFGINTTAKVVKVVWDDIQKRNDTVEIGEPRYSLTQAIESTVDGRVEEVEKKVNAVQVQADGIRLLYRQVERPPNGQHVGDLWYQPNGIYEIMYIWDGSDWKLMFDTSDLDRVKREVDAAQQQAEANKQKAEADLEAAKEDAKEYTDALRKEHETMMGGIQQEANAIKQTADQTKADINTAITAAGFTDLSTTFTGLKRLAATAEATAQKGIANAATALGQANSALSGLTGKADNVFVTAELAKKVALDAYNQKISQIDTAVNSQSLRIDKTEADLRLTAKQTDVDAVKGRLTTAELDIQASANGLKLKADKTEVAKLDAEKASKDYILSRGQNLVTNGTGLLGDNTNFSQFEFDSSDVFSAQGSFKTSRSGTHVIDEFIPVDVNEDYKLSWYGKTNPSVGARHYSAIVCYDVDKKQISPNHIMYVKGTLTKLAKPLNPGDTVLVLEDVTGWLDAEGGSTHKRSAIFWNYMDSKGYKYPPLTYSRYSYLDLWEDGAIGRTTNTITLRQPWLGRTIPTGTPVSNGSSGSTYKYIGASNAIVPDVWTNYSGIISGVDDSGNNANDMFSPGTAYVSVGWLANRGVPGGTLWVSNISFGIDSVSNSKVDSNYRELNAALDIQAGLIAGKVSQSDFNVATGRITKAEAELVIQADAISKRVATTDFNALAGRVSETESVNRQQSGLIEQKVSNTVYEADINNPTNGLKKKVSTAESTLVQQADLISQKVNTTDFDSLKGTVTTQGTELTAAKNAILAKAEKSVVDTLTGRVSTAEGRLTIAEDGLLLAATKTEVTTAIGETEKKINAVSASLSVEAGKVETLITKTDGQQTAINNVVMTANTNKATIYNHTGRISTVERNVNGLQTTVANKAEQSQVTQLAGSLSSVIKQVDEKDIITLDGVGKSFKNVASYTYYTNITGYLIVKTPITASYMTRLKVAGYNFNGAKSDLDLTVSFYAYTSNSFTNYSYKNTGNYSVSSVQLGRDANGRTVVIIGGLDTWRYPKILLEEVTLGHQNPPASFAKEFSIAIETNITPYRTNLTNVTNGADIQSAITQNATAINLKVSKGDVSSQINIEAGRTLISTGKLILDANTYIMGMTFANDVKAKSLEAVDANIASIRAKILVANVVESTHIKADTALVNKLFATTALIDTLTTKLAFINAVKAIDIAADRITTGTLNAANVNLINVNVSSLVGNTSLFVQSAWNFLDATTSITGAGLVTQSGSLSTRLTGGEVTTTSGTKTGKINALGMEIYDSSNGQTTRLFSDGFEFNWYGIKRVIEQNSEGLTIRPISGSGNRLNSSLHLITGSGADKVAYIDFQNPTSGNGARIILQGLDVGVRHPGGGVVQIADLSNDGRLGNLRAGTFQTSTYDGRGLRIVETQINTLADNQTIYIIPSGTGELRIGSGGSSPSLWPVRASRFVEGSSRASKTNIRPYTGSALAEINRLQAVTFNRKEDLANGINYTSLGFIAEDSPFIAIQQPGAPAGVDHYKMATLALKGIQELDLRTRRSETYVNQHELEIQALKKRISELEEKIA